MYNPLSILLAFIRAILLGLSMTLLVGSYIILTSTVMKDTPKRAYQLRHYWIKMALFILGIRIEKQGQAIEETALYVCNHRSFSDPVIVLYFLDAYVIAKAEVADMPVINKGAHITGILYVKRENKNSRTQVRNKMVDTLKKGLNVLVYPEGTTNYHKHVMPLRIGTFIEARNYNFPIIPIVCEYRTRFDVWHNKSFLHQFFFQFRKLRTDVKLTFGPVIRDGSGEEIGSIIENWMNSEIDRMHERWDSCFSPGYKGIRPS